MARLTLIGTAALIVLLAAGCGGESSSGEPTKIVVEPPTTPTDAECGLTGEGSPEDADKPPTPGTYLYTLKGRRIVLGDEKKVTQLPRKMGSIVTGSIDSGAQSCFKVQRRYEEDLGDTGVMIINGREMLLRSGEFQAGGDIAQFIPDPPILVLSDTDLEWDGTFDGATTGRYEVSVIGRKKIRVGDEKVATVGLESRVAYSGEIEGVETATRWFSLKHRMVVTESVVQERNYGLDRLKLEYESKLQSIEPE